MVNWSNQNRKKLLWRVFLQRANSIRFQSHFEEGNWADGTQEKVKPNEKVEETLSYMYVLTPDVDLRHHDSLGHGRKSRQGQTRGPVPQKFGVGTLMQIVPKFLSCFKISRIRLLALQTKPSLQAENSTFS